MAKSIKRPPKVVTRKLGRHASPDESKVWGYADGEKNEVHIDPRQPARRHLRTLVHEMYHKMYPDWSEAKVDRDSRLMAFFLWDQGFRKVILK